MFSFSMAELILVLVVVLVVFGPGKLPEVGKALGRGLSEFKEATSNEVGKNKIIHAEIIKPEKLKEEK